MKIYLEYFNLKILIKIFILVISDYYRLNICIQILMECTTNIHCIILTMRQINSNMYRL